MISWNVFYVWTLNMIADNCIIFKTRKFMKWSIHFTNIVTRRLAGCRFSTKQKKRWFHGNFKRFAVTPKDTCATHLCCSTHTPACRVLQSKKNCLPFIPKYLLTTNHLPNYGKRNLMSARKINLILQFTI